MNQSHLHQLFQELGSNLACPVCQSKIPIQCLQVQSIKGNIGWFEANCDSCGNSLAVSAVIEAKVTNFGKKLNASSLLTEPVIIEETPISNQEVMELKNVLNNFTSVKSLFNQSSI